MPCSMDFSMYYSLFSMLNQNKLRHIAYACIVCKMYSYIKFINAYAWPLYVHILKFVLLKGKTILSLTESTNTNVVTMLFSNMYPYITRAMPHTGWISMKTYHDWYRYLFYFILRYIYIIIYNIQL
jgi:hypothetical protein